MEYFRILACIFVVYTTAVNSLNQQIVLHDAAQNNSTNYTITESTANVSAVAPNATRACTNGMWMVYTKANYSEGSLHSALTSQDTTSCTDKSSPILSVRHAGHANLTMSAISLYNNTVMAAGAELYFEGYSLALPAPLSMGSYGFTGTRNWTVVLADDGKSVCLDLPKHDEAQLNATKGNVLTYKEKAEYKIREIRAGCNGGDTQLPEYEMPAVLAHLNATAETATNHTMSDANSPGLQLSIRIGTNEMGNLTFIGTKLRLIEPMMILNYSFVGQSASNWTIYSDVHGMMGAKCLIHGTKFNATEFGNATYIGSIEVGCDKMSGASSANFHQLASIMLIALCVLVAVK